MGNTFHAFSHFSQYNELKLAEKPPLTNGVTGIYDTTENESDYGHISFLSCIILSIT